MRQVSDLEESLGVTFQNESLLQRALVHRSYLNENPDTPLTDNERLEFLGDAVLDYLTAAFLYDQFPDMPEGNLTSLRAALVREETLARFARELDLGVRLMLGRGEAADGGRERAPNLCAAFEAVVGAICLDQGIETAKEIVVPRLEAELDRIVQAELDQDPKSLLQELSQGLWQITPRYRTVAEKGPDHAKEFTVEVLIDGEAYGCGVGPSKQAAEREAASEALEQLQKIL